MHLVQWTMIVEGGTAAVHVGDHQRAEVLILDRTLELVVPGGPVSVVVGVVLEIALASLIADGAVQRVVDQDELQHTAPGQTSGLRVRVHSHGGCDLRAARGDGFGRLGDLDQTHSAVAGDLEPLVVAEPGNDDAVLLARLIDGEIGLNLSEFRGTWQGLSLMNISMRLGAGTWLKANPPAAPSLNSPLLAACDIITYY